MNMGLERIFGVETHFFAQAKALYIPSLQYPTEQIGESELTDYPQFFTYFYEGINSFIYMFRIVSC